MLTLEDFKEEILKYFKSLYVSDVSHCDTWLANDFTASPNGKYMAFIKLRMYTTYKGISVTPYASCEGRSEDYNALVIFDFRTDEPQKKETSFEKYQISSTNNNGYYAKEKHIEEIISVSDEGIVVYQTADGQIRNWK